MGDLSVAVGSDVTETFPAYFVPVDRSYGCEANSVAALFCR